VVKGWKPFFVTIFLVAYLFSNTAFVSFHLTTTMSKVPSSRAAISNVAADLTGVLEKASHVLVGRVEGIESRWDKTTSVIYTYVHVYVEECLKGTIQGEHVTVKHRGGEIGDIGLWVSGEPRFILGEKIKLFLKHEETGEFTVLGGREGKISLASPASSGFSYSGIHWDRNDLPVPYYINENGTPDVPGTTKEFQAVQASFQTWEDDPESFMDYIYMGTTTRGDEPSDGYNVVSWQPIDGPNGVLAQATCWYNRSTKLMIEFDIVFDEDETWSTAEEPGKYDIQNVGTHEAGHTLVLEDLYDSADSEQTMYGYSSPSETKKRTLEAGDIAGIRYIYPSPKPVYTITTSPSGLEVIVDGTAYTSPRSFEWSLDSTHTVYASSTQSGGVKTRYVFLNWSDGGAQQHQITVGASSVTITAAYLTQHFATIETQGLTPAYPAMVHFTQFGGSKTSSASDSWSDWCDTGSTLTIGSPVNGEEGQRWLTYDTASWTVNSALTATVNYVLQYRVSMVFKTYDHAATLQPTQVKILGGSPNSTLLTLESYSDIWLDNVTWALERVLWRNSNVVALESPSVNLAPNYEWTITCRVYLISFDSAFNDFKGAALSENPSSFALQFPNGTVSGQLNPLGVYYIQNGTTRWESITWQGVEVVPPGAYFDATDGNPTVNCHIYHFAIRVSDFFGFPVSGAQVSTELSDGRTVSTQTGPDGVAVIRMVPQGGFTATISYLAQTVTVSGDVAEAAASSVEAKITFSLPTLVLLLISGVLACVLAIFLVSRMAKSRRVHVGVSSGGKNV